MKRSDALVSLSRREFCGGLAGCLGLAALASCSDGSSPAQPDAPPAMPDASTSGACATSGTDVGAPSTFIAGKPVYFSSGNFWVVRDAMGLYALTARCTHQGGTTVVSGGDFYCPLHGAKFDFNGNVVSGPVIVGLVHYAMCMLPNGHVGVLRTMTVPQAQRLAA